MMCRSSTASKPGFGHRHHDRHGRFFGLDPEEMGPGAQVVTSLAILAPVALSGVALVVFAPAYWWIFTTYFWVAFPAFGLLARGIAGLDAPKTARLGAPETPERKLLGALRQHREITPALAAAETSLSVAETDRLLKELAQNGHLEMRVRGGGIFYALWETGEGAPEPERSTPAGSERL